MWPWYVRQELFSIGLYELNPDGTRVKDAQGEDIVTYDNEDIMTFARLWTGFNTHSFRGGLEDRIIRENNRVDPSAINGDKHDYFPKVSKPSPCP